MSRKDKKKDKIESKDIQSSQAIGDEPELDTETVDETPSPEQQVEQLTQQLQRLAADYQNFQKRSHKQIEQAGQFARQSIAKDLLAVLDSFEHTFSGCDENQDATDVIKGVRIIYDQLLNILSSHSVQPIKVQPGDSFDPTLHEAMLRQESDEFAENSIIAEFACGYTINGITLRPAKVSVARAVVTPPEAENPDQESNDADV